MPITLADVAELAGVSRSAVSRTFTPGASVSAGTRRKVEAAAEKLGYRPNMIARSLSTKRTHLVGLICNNFHNPYLMEVFEYFTEQLQAHHLRPLLVNLSGDTNPQDSINLLHQYRVDAVIVASSTLPPDFTLSFKEAGIPCIHVFGRSADEPEVNIVGINNRMGGRLAANSLIERGYERLAFLGGPADATSTKDRETGFRLAMEEHNREIVCSCHTERYAYEDGYYKMQQLLEQHQFDGLFCGDDVITIGALTAAREHGIEIPKDLGVIGFNDMEMSRWPGMDFSTIRQPTEDIAKSTVELLQAMLKEPERTPEARIFSCTLVDRGTLRPLTKNTG
jgi:DNA-binding LacI/PurR family transcriptional regulator